MNPTPHSTGYVAALLAALVLTSCRDKAEPTAASAAPSASVRVYGLAPGEDVPASCRAYAQKVLQCMQDSHFPKEAREAQTSALAQMMDRMKLADVPAAERAEALKNAADECDVTLSSLREASRTSCPSAF